MDWSTIPAAFTSTTTGAKLGSWLYRVANTADLENSVLQSIGPGTVVLVGEYRSELVGRCRFHSRGHAINSTFSLRSRLAPLENSRSPLTLTQDEPKLAHLMQRTQQSANYYVANTSPTSPTISSTLSMPDRPIINEMNTSHKQGEQQVIFKNTGSPLDVPNRRDSFVLLDKNHCGSINDSSSSDFFDVQLTASVSRAGISVNNHLPHSLNSTRSTATATTIHLESTPRSFRSPKKYTGRNQFRPSPPDPWYDVASSATVPSMELSRVGTQFSLSSSISSATHSSSSPSSTHSYDINNPSNHKPLIIDDTIELSDSQVIIDRMPCAKIGGRRTETWMTEFDNGFTVTGPIDDLDLIPTLSQYHNDLALRHHPSNDDDTSISTTGHDDNDDDLAGMVQSLVDDDDNDDDNEFDPNPTSGGIFCIQDLMARWEAFPWFTYRTDLHHDQFRSDTGWGCMHRTIQMVVARAFFTCAFGTKHCSTSFNASPEAAKAYLAIIDLFRDASIHKPSGTSINEGCFSIGRICQAGASPELGIRPGARFSPTVAAQAVQKLNEQRRISAGLTGNITNFVPIQHIIKTSPLGAATDLLVRVALNATVPLAELLRLTEYSPTDTVGNSNKTCTSPIGSNFSNTEWRPVLLLIPVRLGIHDVHPIYIPNLLDVFTWPSFVGISGGKKNASYYFVGTWTRPSPSNSRINSSRFDSSRLIPERDTNKQTTQLSKSTVSCTSNKGYQFVDETKHSRLGMTTSESLIDRTDLLYLDPHLPQPVPLRTNQVPNPLLHSDCIRVLPLKQIDPCMVLGFVLRNRRDYDEFIDRVSQWSDSPLFSVDTCDYPSSVPIDDDIIPTLPPNNNHNNHNGNVDYENQNQTNHNNNHNGHEVPDEEDIEFIIKKSTRHSFPPLSSLSQKLADLSTPIWSYANKGRSNSNGNNNLTNLAVINTSIEFPIDTNRSESFEVVDDPSPKLTKFSHHSIPDMYLSSSPSYSSSTTTTTTTIASASSSSRSISNTSRPIR